MDRVKAALGTARALSERHGRGLSGRAGTFSRELAGRFALQLLLVDRGIRDALGDAAVEVVLSVEPAMDSGADAEQTARWCKRVADMYDGWVTRRHMQGTQRALPSLARSLVVSGFGAASVLLRENGLHVLESEDAKRCVARVRVAPLWAAESAAEVPTSACEGIGNGAGGFGDRATLSHRAVAAGARCRTRLAHRSTRRCHGRRFRPVLNPGNS